MKAGVTHIEEKLLEYAYGELVPAEHAAVQTHLRGCAKCSAALAQLTAVRSTLQLLPPEPAPTAGLESLLAYAEQAAQRSKPKSVRPWWSRAVMALGSAAALVTAGVVAWRASPSFQPVESSMHDQMAAPPSVPAPAPVTVAKSEEAPLAGPVAGAPARAQGSVASVFESRSAEGSGRRAESDAPAPPMAKKQAAGEKQAAGLNEFGTRGAGRASDAKDAVPVIDREAVAFAGAGDDAKLRPAVQNSVGPPPPPPKAAYGLNTNQDVVAQAQVERKSLEFGRGSAGNAAPPAQESALSEKLGGKADKNAESDPAEETAPRLKTKPADARGRISEALAALERRVTGSERMDALSQLCAGYQSLGEPAKADTYCDALAAEFPAAPLAKARARRDTTFDEASSPKAPAPAKRSQPASPTIR